MAHKTIGPHFGFLSLFTLFLKKDNTAINPNTANTVITAIKVRLLHSKVTHKENFCHNSCILRTPFENFSTFNQIFQLFLAQKHKNFINLNTSNVI